jgi:hypothetical protein
VYRLLRPATNTVRDESEHTPNHARLQGIQRHPKRYKLGLSFDYHVAQGVSLPTDIVLENYLGHKTYRVSYILRTVQGSGH